MPGLFLLACLGSPSVQLQRNLRHKPPGDSLGPGLLEKTQETMMGTRQTIAHVGMSLVPRVPQGVLWALSVCAGVFSWNYSNKKDREEASVLLVGWGTRTINGSDTPYWIAKQSWSSVW